jgi:hypothetical protein
MIKKMIFAFRFEERLEAGLESATALIYTGRKKN